MSDIIREKEKKILSTVTLASYLISGGVITPIIRNMKELTDQILSSRNDTRIVLSHKDIAEMKNYNIIDTIEVGGETINIVTDENTNASQALQIPPTNEDGIIHIEEPSLTLNFETQEEMITFYCKVFQLKEDIITDKINELINNDHYSWEYGNMLNGVYYDTVEQAIARTIADISLRPEEFNLQEENIRLEEYELDEYLPEELIYKFSNVVGVNPNIALAIAYGESGTSLDSYNFTTNYNVAGLHRRTGDPSPTTSEGYVIYRNEADGLFRFILVLHDNFYVTEESDRNRIDSMANTYCAVPDHWRSLIGGIYYELENNGYDYIYTTYNYQERDLIFPAIPEHKIKIIR